MSSYSTNEVTKCECEWELPLTVAEHPSCHPSSTSLAFLPPALPFLQNARLGGLPGKERCYLLDGQPSRDQVKLLDYTGSWNHRDSHEGSWRAARGCRWLICKPFQMWQARELGLGGCPGGRLQSALAGPQCEPQCPAPEGAGLAGGSSRARPQPRPGAHAAPPPRRAAARRPQPGQLACSSRSGAEWSWCQGCPEVLCGDGGPWGPRDGAAPESPSPEVLQWSHPRLHGQSPGCYLEKHQRQKAGRWGAKGRRGMGSVKRKTIKYTDTVINSNNVWPHQLGKVHHCQGNDFSRPSSAV